MSENAPVTARTVDLALLVDLEARWENLRPDRSAPTDRESTHEDLTRKQRAYESFRVKLAEFTKKYPPGYVPAYQRGTPVRLAVWLRKMRDLYRQVEHAPQVPSPVHLLEKAYNCADGMADRVGKDRFHRAPAAETVQAVVGELDALAQWCDGAQG